MWLRHLHAQFKKKHYLLYTIHTAIEVLKSDVQLCHNCLFNPLCVLVSQDCMYMLWYHFPMLLSHDTGYSRTSQDSPSEVLLNTLNFWSAVCPMIGVFKDIPGWSFEGPAECPQSLVSVLILRMARGWFSS